MSRPKELHPASAWDEAMYVESRNQFSLPVQSTASAGIPHQPMPDKDFRPTNPNEVLKAWKSAKQTKNQWVIACFSAPEQMQKRPIPSQ
ncbi:hypothetical protein PTKU46_90290 [Paraburkholderia terrae]